VREKNLMHGNEVPVSFTKNNLLLKKEKIKIKKKEFTLPRLSLR
jgi:hypothetical protein